MLWQLTLISLARPTSSGHHPWLQTWLARLTRMIYLLWVNTLVCRSSAHYPLDFTERYGKLLSLAACVDQHSRRRKFAGADSYWLHYHSRSSSDADWCFRDR